MTAAALLIADLEAGLPLLGVDIAVRPPGAPIGPLPCVQLTLADMPAPTAGTVIAHRYDCLVLVPRASAVEQVATLEGLTEAVLEVLIGTGYLITGTMRAIGDQAEDVPYIGRSVPVETRSVVICA